MLGYWRSHKEYQNYLVENLTQFYIDDPKNVQQYEDILSKLYLLDLDPLKQLLAPYYSITGAPAKNQPELIRSFLLMSDQHCHGIQNWVRKLSENKILCTIIGLPQDEVHQVGSYYDLIDRLWLSNPDVDYTLEHSLHFFKKKPKKKLGKNQKQPPRHPGIIQKFVDLALQGKTFESRPELLMQQIFARIGVSPAAKEGLYGDTEKLDISGDGTCVETGGNSYGNKKCNCVKKGKYNCTCPRMFSDPYARWGWDSYHEQWFYGYTEYILSVHNQEIKCDLPLYLRMVQAQRFDGVSAIVALSEVRKLYPEFKFNSFIGDGAHDNYPTYQLLNNWGMEAFIPLSEKDNKYPPHVSVDDNGVPQCIGGHSMVYWGFNPDRARLKYRCPLVLGKVDSCSCKDKCSPSAYGRCIYTYPAWNYRLFTSVPRGSDQWKAKMNQRTASERVNKRILNDYELEESKSRGKKRMFWRSVVHSINIILDARIRNSKFSFMDILMEKAANAA